MDDNWIAHYSRKILMITEERSEAISYTEILINKRYDNLQMFLYQ